ncbi:ethionine resistance protein [Basidiobolus ranarum]|uniref:Ethionine resistance protein n=1 Tax=Basidiobolus ranarum TaxID=34480 RepID=A0ABR2VYN1_9FUNG
MTLELRPQAEAFEDLAIGTAPVNVAETNIAGKGLSVSDETTNLLGDAKARLDIDPAKWRFEVGKEAYMILVKAVPILIASLLTNVTRYATVFSLGRLGTKELAACALAGVFEACSAISPFLGVLTALETLCSQAHTGSENKHMLGIYLQRAITLQLISFVPIIWIWSYAEQILVAIGQNPEIAHMAGQFIIWSIPGVMSIILAECVKKFLNAQGIMRASAYVSAITAPISLVLFYFLVVNPPTSLGFIGAPIAAGITNFLSLILYVGYAILIEGKQGWGGFSKEAFKGWWPFMKLGLPGMIMICSELWAFEIISLCASYLGTVALAAQSIIGTTLMLFIMVSLGITIAACNRVGNLIGSAQPHRAALVAKITLAMGTVIGVLNCTTVWALRDSWGYMYNKNEEVVLFVSNILPVVAIILLFQSMGGVCNGILRGLGKQKVGAFIKVGSYYVVALPIGLLLTFYGGFGLKGLWMGIMSAYIVCFVLELIVVMRTDWNVEVRKCLHRISA